MEGVRGNDYGGDIAIDDFSVSPGACPMPGKLSFFVRLVALAISHDVTMSRCLPLRSFNINSLHLLVGDCDFERNACTWYNTRVNDTFDWLRGNAKTQTQFTGPSQDHTTGSGMYGTPLVLVLVCTGHHCIISLVCLLCDCNTASHPNQNISQTSTHCHH